MEDRMDNIDPKKNPFLNLLGQLGQKMTPAQQAAQNDQRLSQAAMYWESKGLTVMIASNEALSAKFVEFKRLVRTGRFTVEQIEDIVANKYGCVDDPVSAEDTIDAFLNELPTECDEA
jgi:hypothetical protein